MITDVGKEVARQKLDELHHAGLFVKVNPTESKHARIGTRFKGIGCAKMALMSAARARARAGPFWDIDYTSVVETSVSLADTGIGQITFKTK